MSSETVPTNTSTPAFKFQPWSDEKIREVMNTCWTPQTEPDSSFVAFALGVRSREREEMPKPFPAAGQWFPLDILGNPMREVSPGHWENLIEPSTSFINKILTAFQNGIQEANKQYPYNPYLIHDSEWRAWERGVAYGNARDTLGSQPYLVQRITTAYEQGVGQGQRTDVINPYKPNSPEYQAWNNGREISKKRLDNGNAWS